MVANQHKNKFVNIFNKNNYPVIVTNIAFIKVMQPFLYNII